MIRNSVWKKLIVILLAAVMVTGNFTLLGPVYAAEDGGSGNTVLASSEGTADETEELNDTETDLDALGFDTSELPEGYDPDSQDNPYGTEYTTLQEFGELISSEHASYNTFSGLYGHEVELEKDYAHFRDCKSIYGINKIRNSAMVAAAGDFKGTGRRSCLAYASLESQNTPEGQPTERFKLNLRIYDYENEESSNPISVLKDDTYISFTGYDGPVQNYIDIDTGDYDGDGLDEIALIVPQTNNTYSAEKCKMVIYKIRTNDGDVCNTDNWKQVWSYTMPKGGSNNGSYIGGSGSRRNPQGGYNNIDISSGDITGDGIDDMILSWGRSILTDKGLVEGQDLIESTSLFLLGDNTGNMLRKTQELSLGDKELCRVAFCIGDINADGENDVIMGGQLISDAVDNNEARYLGYYAYDADKGLLLPEHLQRMEVVASGNGYDDKYMSLPGAKANLDLAEVYGKTEGVCVYMDSVLYSFDTTFEIIDELDEANSGPLASGSTYIEYNAISSYFTDALAEGLVVERYYPKLESYGKYSADLIHLDYTEDEDIKLIKEDKSFTDISITKDQKDYGIISNGSFNAVIDTDQDSALMRYTGKNHFEYSEPKVYAVLASAPYFGDLEKHVDECIRTFSGTSWGKSTGSSDTDGWSVSANLGVAYSHSGAFNATSISAGGVYNHSHSETKTKNFSITYSPIAGLDCVVFFSIPTAVYEYDVIYQTKDDEGRTVQKTEKDYVSIPYQPVSQTLALKDYNKIQKTSDSLPVLDGTAITSKVGDPASYPHSSKGFKDAKVYDGDWVTPSYSTTGGVTQTISSSSSTSDTNAGGWFFNASSQWGTKTDKVGPSGSVTNTYSDTTATSSSETASGTVHNPGPACDGYGYYYSWKLMTYKYELENGDSFPVVTYLTKDVTTPPILPTDFAQDHSSTTDSQIGLKWTYSDKSATAFDVYRHSEYTDGSNDVLVGTVSAADYTLKKNKNGALLYDENDNTIKEYSIIDTGENGSGLSEYTDYEYRIQVRRDKVPPKSIPSKLVKCKTRARYNPELKLSDTDLTVYYDTIKTVSVDVKESDSFLIKNKSFQWQKYNEKSGVWEDIVLADKSTYKFSKCDSNDAGEYRCRVNCELTALGNVYRITSYTETLNVDYTKRDVRFGDVTCEEDGNITRFTLPVTNSGDGARTQPQGYVKFALDNGQDKLLYTAAIDNTTNTATAEFKDLPDGAYELTERYEGDSRTFKSATNTESFTYMKNIDSGMWLSMKSSYRYNEDLMDSLKLYDLQATSSGVKKTDITDQITKVLINTKVKTSEYENTEQIKPYAEFDLSYAQIKTVRIPCRFEQKDPDTEPKISNDNLYLEVYIGQNKVADSVEHKLNVKKGSLTLYLDDIEFDAGSYKSNAGADNIKIKDAEGYNDGDSPFRAPTAAGPGQEAFTNSTYFRVGLYLPTGEMVSITEPWTYETKFKMNDLSPGEYILKPIIVRSDREMIAEDNFFDIDFAESSLTIRGDTYKVTALGETINERKVGSVSLIAPDQIDEVNSKAYQGGTSLTFKAHPAAGYSIKYWIVHESGKDRIIDSTSDTLKYIVRGTSTDITIKAVFDLSKNRLNVQTLGGGDNSTVECTSDSLGSDPIVTEGKELSFKAKAGSGYEFLEWRYVTVDGKTTVRKGTTSDDRSESTVQFTMGNASAIVYAVFQKQKADVEMSDHLTGCYLNKTEYNAYLAEGAEISLEDNEMTVPTGAELIVRPEKGYKVKAGSWTVTGADYKSAEGGRAISITIPEDAEKISVTAECIPGQFGISTEETVNADVKVFINGKETENHSSVAGGSTYEIAAIPHRGYTFSCWKINGETISNASDIYSGIVTENMNVEAVCTELTPYEINTDIKGNGTVSYEIETLAGESVKGNADGTPIEMYEGETITFTSVPGQNYMASYIIADGTRSEYTDKEYSITDIDGDHDITFGFDTAVSHNVKVINNTDYTVKSSEGRYIEDDITLGSGEECTILISGVPDLENPLFVYFNGKRLPLINENVGTYRFTFTNTDKDSVLTIDKEMTYYIYDADDFVEFREALKSENQNASGILMNDITVTSEMFSGIGPTHLNGTFDGNGYCIKGSSLNDTVVEDAAQPMFTDVNGTIKNLTIRDFTIKGKIDGDGSDSRFALVADFCKGTITDCAISKVHIAVDKNDISAYWLECGGFARMNVGTISDCLVKELQIDNTVKSGAIAYVNGTGQYVDAVVKNCYVDSYSRNVGQFPYSRICIGTGNSVENCWYNMGGADSGDSNVNGQNIYVDGTKLPVAELAYALNGSKSGGSWGSWNDDPEAIPVPISLGTAVAGKEVKAPVVLTYKVRYSSEREIVIPGLNKLKVIDDVDAWTNGTACYPAGAEVLITADDTFEPVEDVAAEYGYVVMKSGDTVGERYFKTIEEAVKYLAGKEGYDIHVKKDTNISSKLKIAENTGLYLEEGVKFTVSGSGTLENDGQIYLDINALIVNYGTILNNGTGSIDGMPEKLIRNSGSISTTGVLDLKERVTCVIHMWGGEQTVKEPTVSEEGESKIVCEICGDERHKTIDRLDESVKLTLSSDKVELALGGEKTVLAKLDPSDCIGTVSWSSDNERVATVETSAEGKGVKAVLSGNAEGSANITATYTNEFGYKVSASMQCRVAAMTPITGISFDKEEYTMFEGATKVLRARIEPVDADEKLIWSSDDESIVTVDENGVLTAEGKGSTNITVRAEGMLGGDPVSTTVNIRVIDESDITGDYSEIQDQLDALGGRVDELTGQLDEAVQDISDQQTVLDSLVEKLGTLDNELNDEATGLKEQMKKVQDELTSAKTEIDSLRSSVEDSVTEIENSKARISELETELVAVNTELANIKKRQDLSEKEQKDLEEELTAEQDKLQGELEETKTKLEEAINDIETNRRAIQEKSEALEKTINELNAAEKMISDMSTALGNLAERTGTLEEGQQDLTKSQIVLLENIDTMTADLKNLTSGLEGTAAELQKAKEQIATLEEAINEIRQDVGALVFIDSPLFDVESGVVGGNIRTTDFSDFALCGTRPYVFTAENLPDGISLTSDGVLSGKFSKADEAAKTATITAKDAEGTTRSIEVVFGAVKPANISSVSAKYVVYKYTGEVRRPTTVVKDANGNVLKKDVDYTVTKPASKSVGGYTLTVKGKGNYTGTKTLKYKIIPATSTIKSITSGKRKMTVKMTAKPTGKGASRYQIYYKQKGKSTWKKTTATSSYKTIKKLRKGKRYYVKVRAYKTVNSKKYYGAWSKIYLSKKIK